MKLKTPFALLVLSLALTASNAAMNPAGGSWANVTVIGATACTAARCPPHGWVTFLLSASAAGNPPACSSDNRNQVAIDTSDVEAGGRFAAVMLQTASMTATALTISGTGKCTVDSVIETLGTVTEASRNASAPVHEVR